LRQRTPHAHAVDDFGVAERKIGSLKAACGRCIGTLQRTSGQAAIDQGESQQDDCTDEGDEPEEGVQQKDEGEIDRHPRRVEESHNPRAPEK
jgi:hypothetical protein